jgi:hypothetical protein
MGQPGQPTHRTDAGTEPADETARPPVRSRRAEGILGPVDYSRRTTYGRPPELYRGLQWMGPRGDPLGSRPGRGGHSGGSRPAVRADPAFPRDRCIARRPPVPGGPRRRVRLGPQRPCRGWSRRPGAPAAPDGHPGRGSRGGASADHPRLPASVGAPARLARSGQRSPPLLRSQREPDRRGVVTGLDAARIESLIDHAKAAINRITEVRTNTTRARKSIDHAQTIVHEMADDIRTPLDELTAELTKTALRE